MPYLSLHQGHVACDPKEPVRLWLPQKCMTILCYRMGRCVCGASLSQTEVQDCCDGQSVVHNLSQGEFLGHHDQHLHCTIGSHGLQLLSYAWQISFYAILKLVR